MSDPALPTLAALRQRRDETIALLARHYAEDHLETQELEERIDLAYRAANLQELEGLLHGLPVLAAPTLPQSSRVPVRCGDVAERQFVVAVMGGAERSGVRAPARDLYVVALMGGVALDFRQAEFAPGVTEIHVLALMGGVEIIVPPGVEVQSNGVGIMGGFDHRGRRKHPVDREVPILRVSGAAVMGGSRSPRGCRGKPATRHGAGSETSAAPCERRRAPTILCPPENVSP